MFIAAANCSGVYAGTCRAFFTYSTWYDGATSWVWKQPTATCGDSKPRHGEHDGTDLQAYAYSGEHTGA
jgi:hypothetical protein